MRTRTTIHWRSAGALRAVPTLLAAALVLGGCSATHVGDAWQCPAAQGTACASVAEADPAVTTVEKAKDLGIPERREPAGTDDVGRPGAACAGDCEPLAWLAKWLNAIKWPHEAVAPVEAVTTSPSEKAPDPVRDDLRTEERTARIWIAPFVDSQGFYREGHWVRAVLEPPRWKLR